MRTVYLDYNATTPLDPAVLEAMLPFLGPVWGNPSSVHHVGRRARAALDEAHERAAALLGCKMSELIFTSGGTESVNLAILGTARLLKSKGKHLITSAVEHPAVLHTCEYLARKEDFSLTILPVNREGRISVHSLENALRPETILVSIMAANNEIGTLQPVAELGAACRLRNVIFHTDAVQWFGKEPVQHIERFNADLVSFCAHKFHGPKGAGFLYVRSPFSLDPILFGGAQQFERRAGTENLAAIIGAVEAVSRFVTPPVFSRQALTPLASRLVSFLRSFDSVQFIGPDSDTIRLANTVSFVVPGSDSISVLAALDLCGVCASSGSACSAGSVLPSRVVSALGLPPALSSSLIRLSLGRDSSIEDVLFLERMLPDLIRRVIGA